jgi:hypothetical protein
MHSDLSHRLKVAVQTAAICAALILPRSSVYAQNAVVVKMRDTATLEDKASVKAQLSAATVKPLSIKGVELWTIPDSKVGQIKSVAKEPSVQYIDVSNSPLDALLIKAPQLELNAQQKANLSHIKLMQAQVEPTLVKMEASNFKLNLLADVANPTPLTVPVSSTKTLKIDTEKLISHSPTNYTVFGSVLGSSGSRSGDAVLSVSNGTVVGTISDGADTYSLKPLGGNAYVVTKLDRTKLPPEEPQIPGTKFGNRPHESRPNPSHNSSTDSTKDVPTRGSSTEDGTSTTVRVLVAYTKAVAASDPFIATTIQNDVDITNKTYLDSKIPLTLQLAGTLKENYIETTYEQDLNRLVSPNDGYMDDIHSLRLQDQADVVVLIVQNTAACGLSDAIMADSATAFSLVNYSCAGVNYSLAHELGHLFGARHDFCVDPSPDPYPYGHGYLLSAKKVRTVMAYPNCCSTCVRIGRWADPAASYDGSQLGTVDKENDSLVLKSTCQTVSRFHTELGSKSDTHSGASDKRATQ